MLFRAITLRKTRNYPVLLLKKTLYYYTDNPRPSCNNRRQRKYLTYASSVLFVYDGAAVSRFLAAGGDKGDRLKALERSVRVKLIDFAHVFPNEGEYVLFTGRLSQRYIMQRFLP